METKVLVTGANGQLAQTIQELYIKNEANIQFDFVNKKELDITNFDEVSKYFSENKFNYCINCAAYTNVEQAEESIELAFKVNAEAVKNLALVCNKNKTKIIHISTDYVFDGKKNTPYIETDKANPINQYGKSKLKGEQYLSSLIQEHFIIRTSWLYSTYGKNFVKTIINKINESADLKVTIAETGTPTSCLDLSKFIYKIILSNSSAYGTYHFSNEGTATWFEFAQEIASHFKDYNKNKIASVPSFKTKAIRPLYSVMSKDKASSIFNFKINNWQKALTQTINKL